LALSLTKQVRPSLYYSDGNVRWLRRVPPPGESRWVCAAHPTTLRKKTGRTDGRTPDRYISLCAISELSTKLMSIEISRL